MAKRFAALLATAAAMVLLLCTATAWAGPVTIHDDAKVLDATQVTNAGNALPDPVQVFTTENDANDNAAFDREAQSHISGPTDIVIAINTKSRHLAIRTGRDSHIRSGGPAVAAFKGAFGSGNYTGATVAALQALGNSIGQGAPAHSPARPVHHRSNALWGLLCPLIIVALLVFVVVSLFRGRRSGSGMVGGGFFNRSSVPGPYPPQPGAGPMYGGGGRGMSPGVAGGLGAVGGGLLGYELGKMEGEREDRRDQAFDQSGGYYGGDSQQWGGGGGDGDFGGGSSDFGGGGGGGDFGGGGGSSSDSSNF